MFKEYFLGHGFKDKNGVLFQPGIGNRFESAYLEVRNREGRLYSDEEVKQLPEFKSRHQQEWAVRKRSFQRLLPYLTSRRPATIMEVGCGNGWLIHGLSHVHGIECCGVDINEAELQQACRVFCPRQNLFFVKGDVCSPLFGDLRLDAIILASSLQYFDDLSGTLTILQSLLTKGGEIHILDTPWYERDEIAAAAGRSEQYFGRHQNDAMKEFYHHHSWSDLKSLPYRVEFDPRNWRNRLKNLFQQESPFPWIVIPKQTGR